jgi:cation diffusion facilitator CzcD-associated flavoprotein CzcO
MSDPEPLRFEMDRLVAYDDESIVAEIRRVAALLPPGPITRDAFDAIARMSEATVRNRFGGWRKALERAGLGDRFSRPGADVSAEDVLNDLRRVARVVGRDVLTVSDLRTHGRQATERSIARHFNSLQAALRAAGLESSRHGRRWTDSDYFENLLEVWTYCGRAPRGDEMNLPPSRITGSAYARKFGTWVRAKQAFVDRVNADITENEREDAAQPSPTPDLPPRSSRQEDQRSIPVGLRYQVLRRDGFRCVTCGRSPATELGCVLHVDHVVAFSRGGRTRLENLRSLCESCNIGKAAGDA